MRLLEITRYASALDVETPALEEFGKSADLRRGYA